MLFRSAAIRLYSSSSMISSSAAMPAADEGKDAMDDDEQFEQLQERRVMETQPESLAFVRARQQVAMRTNKNKPRGARR